MEVVDRICKLTDKPDLILSPITEPGAAALGGCKNWRWPDAIQVMHMYILINTTCNT